MSATIRVVLEIAYAADPDTLLVQKDYGERNVEDDDVITQKILLDDQGRVELKVFSW